MTQLKSLQSKINILIPEELRTHCKVANFENGILVFAVQSSVWAMRFRYVVPELLSQLRKKTVLPELSSIEYYIEPEFLNLFNCESSK
ncbi:MAG: DciA family protein [Gammaproteobacteria bacterium]|nr:DciA family protein [Gammaproteobacteria bacterium]